MAKIAFEDKVATRVNTLPEVNQITDGNINEIKASVNALYTETVVQEIDSSTFFMVDSNVQYLPDLPVGKYYHNVSLILKFKASGSNPNMGDVAWFAIKRGIQFITLIEAIYFVANAPNDTIIDANLNPTYPDPTLGLNVQEAQSYINNGYSIQTLDSALSPALITDSNGGTKKLIIEHEYQIRDF